MKALVIATVALLGVCVLSSWCSQMQTDLDRMMKQWPLLDDLTGPTL